LCESQDQVLDQLGEGQAAPLCPHGDINDLNQSDEVA